MTSIDVQGAVVVATMRDIAGRVFEADAPVLDGREGLPSPLGRLALYLYSLAILIRPDDFLSVSHCSQRSQHGTSREIDTAFVKPLERTVSPATTNGHIGY